MSIRQVKDILHDVAVFHKKQGKLFRRAEGASNQELLKHLLHHLARHESRVKAILSRFADRQKHDVNEAWLQNIPEFDADGPLEELGLDASSGRERIVEAAVGLHEHVAGYYRQLAASAPSEELKDLFLGLEENIRTSLREIAVLDRDY